MRRYFKTSTDSAFYFFLKTTDLSQNPIGEEQGIKQISLKEWQI